MICTGVNLAFARRVLPGGDCSKGLLDTARHQSRVMKLYKRYHNRQPNVRYTTAVTSVRDTGWPAIKRTFQPKKRYRRRVHGFLRRMSSRGGVRVVQNRRRKGRQRLSQQRAVPREEALQASPAGRVPASCRRRSRGSTRACIGWFAVPSRAPENRVGVTVSRASQGLGRAQPGAAARARAGSRDILLGPDSPLTAWEYDMTWS